MISVYDYKKRVLYLPLGHKGKYCVAMKYKWIWIVWAKVYL